MSEKDRSGPQDITVWVSMLLLGTDFEVTSENKGEVDGGVNKRRASANEIPLSALNF